MPIDKAKNPIASKVRVHAKAICGKRLETLLPVGHRERLTAAGEAKPLCVWGGKAVVGMPPL